MHMCILCMLSLCILCRCALWKLFMRIMCTFANAYCRCAVSNPFGIYLFSNFLAGKIVLAILLLFFKIYDRFLNSNRLDFNDGAHQTFNRFWGTGSLGLLLCGCTMYLYTSHNNKDSRRKTKLILTYFYVRGAKRPGLAGLPGDRQLCGGSGGGPCAGSCHARAAGQLPSAAGSCREAERHVQAIFANSYRQFSTLCYY